MPKRTPKPKPAPEALDEVEFTPSPALVEMLDTKPVAIDPVPVPAELDDLGTSTEPDARPLPPYGGVTTPEAVKAWSTVQPWPEDVPHTVDSFVEIDRGSVGVYTDHDGIGHVATVEEVLTGGTAQSGLRVNLSVPSLNPPRMSGVRVGEGNDAFQKGI